MANEPQNSGQKMRQTTDFGNENADSKVFYNAITDASTMMAREESERYLVLGFENKPIIDVLCGNEFAIQHEIVELDNPNVKVEEKLNILKNEYEKAKAAVNQKLLPYLKLKSQYDEISTLDYWMPSDAQKAIIDTYNKYETAINAAADLTNKIIRNLDTAYKTKRQEYIAQQIQQFEAQLDQQIEKGFFKEDIEKYQTEISTGMTYELAVALTNDRKKNIEQKINEVCGKNKEAASRLKSKIVLSYNQASSRISGIQETREQAIKEEKLKKEKEEQEKTTQKLREKEEKKKQAELEAQEKKRQTEEEARIRQQEMEKQRQEEAKKLEAEMKKAEDSRNAEKFNQLKNDHAAKLQALEKPLEKLNTLLDIPIKELGNDHVYTILCRLKINIEAHQKSAASLGEPGQSKEMEASMQKTDQFIIDSQSLIGKAEEIQKLVQTNEALTKDINNVNAKNDIVNQDIIDKKQFVNEQVFSLQNAIKTELQYKKSLLESVQSSLAKYRGFFGGLFKSLFPKDYKRYVDLESQFNTDIHHLNIWNDELQNISNHYDTDAWKHFCKDQSENSKIPSVCINKSNTIQIGLDNLSTYIDLKKSKTEAVRLLNVEIHSNEDKIKQIVDDNFTLKQDNTNQLTKSPSGPSISAKD